MTAYQPRYPLARASIVKAELLCFTIDRPSVMECDPSSLLNLLKDVSSTRQQVIDHEGSLTFCFAGWDDAPRGTAVSGSVGSIWTHGIFWGLGLHFHLNHLPFSPAPLMATMTDEEWQHLYENFETHALLDAVDAVDNLRDDLNDGNNCRPPELRTNLLKLHGLAMAVVNQGAVSQAPEMFDLAMDLDEQVSHMMTQLEHIQDTLSQLVALYPESLDHADGDDSE